MARGVSELLGYEAIRAREWALSFLSPAHNLQVVSDQDFNRLYHISYRTFNKVDGSIFKNHHPNWQDIQQMAIGDCYLLAVLKSLVLRSPELIKKIIQETDDGKVIVRLFEPKQEEGHHYYHPVHYKLDKTVFINPFLNGHKAPWVHLLEKAYFLHRLRLDKNKYQLKIGRNSFKQVLSAGASSDVYEHLLGVQSTFVDFQVLKKSNEAILKAMIDLANFQYEPYAACLMFNQEEQANAYLNNFYKDGGLTIIKSDRDWLKTVVFDGHEQLMQDFLQNYPLKDRQQLLLLHEVDRDILFSKMRPETRMHLQCKFKNVYDVLFSALAQGDFICASTRDGQRSIPSLVSGHAYEVINCYQRSDLKGNPLYFVQLSNPWGRYVPGFQIDDSGAIQSKSQPELFNKLFWRKPDVSNEYYRMFGAKRLPAIYKSSEAQKEIDDDPATFEIPLDIFLENSKGIHVTDFKKTVSDLTSTTHDLMDQEGMHEQFVNQLVCKQEQLSDDHSDSALPSSSGSSDSDSDVVMNDADSDSVTMYCPVLQQQILDDNIEQLSKVRDVALAMQANICALKATIPIATQVPEHVQRAKQHPLPALKNALHHYLNNEHRHDIYQKWSKPRRGLHRLFSRHQNRYVNNKRKQCVKLILALIDVHEKMTHDDDKKIIMQMLCDIQYQHNKDVGLMSKMHGNRLGKILTHALYDRYSPAGQVKRYLSLSGSVMLGEKLSEVMSISQFRRSPQGYLQLAYKNVEMPFYNTVYDQLTTRPLLIGKTLVKRIEKLIEDAAVADNKIVKLDKLYDDLLTLDYNKFNVDLNEYTAFFKKIEALKEGKEVKSKDYLGVSLFGRTASKSKCRYPTKTTEQMSCYTQRA